MKASCLAQTYWSALYSKVIRREYSALVSLTDQLLMMSRSGMQKYANVPNSILDAAGAIEGPVEHLFLYVFSTFPGEDRIKKEGNHTFRAPIFNYAIDAKDKPDRDRSAGQYSTIWHLVMNHLEESPQTRHACKARTLLDIWLGWIVS